MQSEFVKLHVGFPPEGKIDRVCKVLGKFHTSFAHVIYHFQCRGNVQLHRIIIRLLYFKSFQNCYLAAKKIFREQRATRKCCVPNFITF